MAEIRVRQRNQITVPVDIARAAGLSEGSLCHMEYANGVITITPANAKSPRPITSYAGTAHGTWGATVDEIIETLDGDRRSWNR